MNKDKDQETTGQSGGQSERSFALPVGTDRERPDKKHLAAKEAEHRDLFDNSNDLIQSVAPDGAFLYVNRTWLNRLEYSIEEVIELKVFEVVDPLCRRKFSDAFERLLNGEKPGRLETEFVSKSGKKISVEGSLMCKFEDGEPVLTRGFFRDLTDRQQAERDLRRSEMKYRRLIEQASDGILITDKNGKFVEINAQGCEMLGFECEDLFELNFWEIIADDDLIRLPFRPDDLHAGQIVRGELILRRKNGEYLPVEISARMIGGENLQIIIRDISDRRRAEKELNRSENRYRSIVENALDIIYTHDLEGNYTSINKAGVEIIGYTHEEILKMNLTQTIAPDCLEKAREMIDRKINSEDESIYDLDVIAKDGRRITIEVNTTVIYEEGKAIGVQGIARDITERRQMENELISRSNLLRNVVEGTPDAVFVKDLEGRYLFMNSAGAKFRGRKIEEFIGRRDEEIYQSAEARRFIEADKRLLKSGETHTFEGTAIGADGSVHTFLVTKAAYRNRQSEIIGIIGISHDITERKRAEQMLQFQKTLLESLSEASLDGILVVSGDGKIISYNTRFVEMWELPKELLENGSDAPVLQAVTEKVFNAEEFLATVQYLNKHPDEIHQSEIALKNERSFERYSAPVKSAEGNYYGRVWYFRDVTERKQLEEKFRQSQKMDAVGQLAGGIAHDFNNLLTAITGYSDLSLRALPVGSQVRNNVEEIKKASERAALLTRQLLAFSRKQVLKPVVFNPNIVVQDVEKMLQRLIGENIRFQLNLSPQLGNVLADPGQIEQVLINLIVNARDAMPTGGNLIIETKNVRFDQSYVFNHITGTPGCFVLLSVSDTGCGMEEKTISRIFEPFFTTKEPGKGTGLGLSTVYGIVKQSGGYVWVYSEPGLGTTFKVYLPRVETNGETAIEVPRETAPQGMETVLLVEDEELLRPLAEAILEEKGYQVIVASNAAEAIERSEDYAGEIDLLLTDVVLPHQNGRELAEQILLSRPRIRVLYMSGYTDDAILHHGVLDTGTNFIQKPFSPDELAFKVREVLDEGKDS